MLTGYILTLWTGKVIAIISRHFVPNLTMGPAVVAAIRQHCPTAFLDCHLMVEDPLKWIEPMAQSGANSITVHVEASGFDITKTSNAVRARGMRLGVAIKPDTPVTAVKPILNHVDMILVMTVEPGFGGQTIRLECLEKVKELRSLFPEGDIQVDGGISEGNVHLAIEAGANVIVAGTAILKSPNRKETIAKMKSN